MDGAAILARSRRTQADARSVRARSYALRTQADAERRALRVLTHSSPALRRARLARGGSGDLEMAKWPGDGLKETFEPICPSCGDRAVKPNGHVRATKVLKSLYLCQACAEPFVFLRTPHS